MSEMVNHPDHYAKGRKYEPYKVIKDWDLDFNLGSAVKYIARGGRKDDAIEDLEKARKYLEYEIEAIKEEYNEESGSSVGGFAPEGKLFIRIVPTSSEIPPEERRGGIIAISKDVFDRVLEAEKERMRSEKDGRKDQSSETRD